MAIGIAFGILQNASDILFAGCMLLAGFSTILLFKWWRAEDLDPKFKILLLLLIAQVLLLGVSLNVNVWNQKPIELSTQCMNYKLLTDPIFSKADSGPWINQNFAPPGCVQRCPQYQGIDWYAIPPTCRPLVNQTK